ncbi:MAG: ATP-binding protein [Paludisphaera borealis]|uniref:sensor histidine kinase n=1 Tax=Paludisphaera borealis TaxID=1387353 RepID=UPI002845DF7A|nr:ATP-binding protein [Paludisphaera borealis]MDR3620884.1 ATP-binding protein [Paludisphaera borealis]
MESPVCTRALTFAAWWPVDHVFPLAAVFLLASSAVGAMAYMRHLRKRHSALATDLETIADQRREAERALRETEAIYYSLVETLPQSILRKDLEGRFTFANKRFCAELGRSLDEIVGKTDYDFFPNELAAKYRADDRRVIESGRVLDVVEEHITPQGDTLHVQVMKTALLDSDGKPIGVQGIFWDVTARIRADEQLREKNVELVELARSEHQAHEARKQAQSLLVQNEKLASLGHLVAGVAHEINNPLSFVSNNVAVMERDLRDLLALIRLYRRSDHVIKQADPKLLEEIEEVCDRIDLDYCLDNFPRLIDRTREGLRRIERIVKELRLFARVDEGEWNEVDLNPGIESSINMVKGYARKKGVHIVMDLGALPAVRCRAARIHQVILNLLTNAIDACGENGEVRVRTETEPDALGVRVDIDDNGCGIEPAILERIFDPFFTTKPLGQGTGLGLSISYGIVQEQNGRIEVQSTPGHGTCFSVHLPIEPVRPPSPDGSGEHPLADERDGPTTTTPTPSLTRETVRPTSALKRGDGAT